MIFGGKSSKSPVSPGFFLSERPASFLSIRLLVCSARQRVGEFLMVLD